MVKLGRVFVCAVVLGVLLGSLDAADVLSEQKKAQNKLLAQRAARADAMRKLAERIKGLHITAETLVRDFVAESDRIETAMTAFLQGVRQKGRPKFMEDGSCEVTLEVTLVDVIINLKEIHRRHYKGDKFKAQDFEQMKVTNETKVLTEPGMGVPRPELQEDEGVLVTEGSYDSFRYLTGEAKKYWLERITGRGRLMAIRAARVDGMRRLAERIKGVYITSETTVQDFVAESDMIDVNMQTFLRGVRETRVRYGTDEMIVEVDMEVTLRTVYATLKSWGQTHYKGDKVKIRKLEELIVKSKDKIIKETGMGVPPEKYLKGVTVVEKAILNTVRGGKVPPWVTQKLKAVGNAAIDPDNPNEAQARLMANRAAELDARRKLAEDIDGLLITSSTSVRDFVAQNDDIQTSMLTYQQSARVVEGSQKRLPDGTVQVTVEIDLKPLWDVIIYWRRKLPKIKIK
jgi:hypothetical protein